MDKVAYSSVQTSKRVYICIKIASTELDLLRLALPVDIVISDLGENGYLIDFLNNDSAIAILTLINGGPLGVAPIEHIPSLDYFV